MTRIRLFIFINILFSFTLIGQFSASSIRSLGIKSEADLQRLGLSSAEIESLKKQYLGETGVTSEKTDTADELEDVVSEGPVENEVSVSKPKQEQPVNYDVFGKNVLRSSYFNLKENSDRINPSPNYTLGTGDRISVTIWGASEYNNEFTLDQFGNITPKLVGRISLKGKTFEESERIIKSRFGKVYNLSASQISINLTFSKVININVVGEVNNPGTYSVPSVNSAFNILALAGGVNDIGSVRKIYIKRNGQTVGILDLYLFLANPQKFSHISLQDGDFIVVPASKNYISLIGEVARPFKYEIIDRENLSSVIEYAGGFTPISNKNFIGIKRIKGSQYEFMNVNFEEHSKIKVLPGDQINVLQISELVSGIVEVRGSVNLPGEFQFTEGDRLLDVITKAQGINKLSYQKIAHVVRTNEDLKKEIISVDLYDVFKSPQSDGNIKLQEFDVVKVYNKSDLFVPDSVQVMGMVLSPGKYPHFGELTLADVVVMADGLKPESDHETIQIERISFDKKDTANSYIKLIKLDFEKDKGFALKPNDIIHFRSLPEFAFQTTVTISGEVKYPGSYTLNGRNEKLSSLIERAGGLSSWAFLEGAKLVRKDENLGVLLMDLKEVLDKKDSKFDYILKPGDVITIPKATNIVSISGAIGYKRINESAIINSPYHFGRRAGFYIKKYGGGYDDKARKRKVYAVSYNGAIKKSKFFGLIKPKIEKGDEIKVEYKKKRTEKREKGEPIDWNRIIENVTVKATGVLTLLILVDRAFGN